ncbi:MAG: hypothetical protein IT342_06445 [Candidatus Melainabacteria bacterium]|nr:hypothetical protein [Candidatus Melainabacteria bacterium]
MGRKLGLNLQKELLEDLLHPEERKVILQSMFLGKQFYSRQRGRFLDIVALLLPPKNRI